MTQRGVLAVFLLFAWIPAASGQVRLSGRITNENDAPLGGAKIVLHPEGSDAEAAHTYAEPTGDYAADLPAPGRYRADVERLGHFPLKGQALDLAAGENRADFVLNRVREVLETVEVVAAPPPIDLDTSASSATVTGAKILNIPYATTNNLRNALRIVPGVVQDASGRLHIDGGKEDQTLFTLNGFNITDPLTGRFESRLSVEAVQTVDVTSGRVGAEYGKGSAGVLQIHTKTGDDKFRVSATNFIPGIEEHKGLMIGNWTPRINFSGPIKRGRAWFSDAFDTQFSNTVIKELPKGEDRTRSWRASNHLSTQVNVTDSNILYAGFLANYFTAPRDGLGVLDPRETTVDRRSRQWFFHVKDQIYLPRQVLLEVGYAANRTFGREIPQGQEVYQFTPEGRRGNFFLDATRKSARDQFLLNVFLPEFEFLGEHRFKTGTDLNRLSYWQDARRTGFENLGRDSVPTRRTVFGGSGVASILNYEASVYVQDSWRLRPKLLLEAGLRGDWDQILHYWNVSPRLGLAWSPPGLEKTKISAGYGIIHDATSLRTFSRPLDQYSITTYFSENGEPDFGPAVTLFTIRNPVPPRPRYRNQSIGLEQEWDFGLHSKLELLRKRGRYGFTYVNILPRLDAPMRWLPEDTEAREFDGVYDLTNDRRDKYDAVRVTVRQSVRGKYEWLASYTHSSARSNAVADANIDDPLTFYENDGPMPWDTPHRLQSHAYFPLPLKNWAFAYLLDWRAGFPFSIVDDRGGAIGNVNSHRFPTFFELNVHVERRFRLKKHLWALRMGCNNVTDHGNPNVVNNNVASRNFMQFYGGADRSFNFRIRWLGRPGS